MVTKKKEHQKAFKKELDTVQMNKLCMQVPDVSMLR